MILLSLFSRFLHTPIDASFEEPKERILRRRAFFGRPLRSRPPLSLSLSLSKAEDVS